MKYNTFITYKKIELQIQIQLIQLLYTIIIMSYYDLDYVNEFISEFKTSLLFDDKCEERLFQFCCIFRDTCFQHFVYYDTTENYTCHWTKSLRETRYYVKDIRYILMKRIRKYLIEIRPSIDVEKLAIFDKWIYLIEIGEVYKTFVDTYNKNIGYLN